MKERESNCVTDMIREIRLLEEENQKLKDVNKEMFNDNLRYEQIIQKLKKELKHEINTVWDLSKRLSDTEKELEDLKEKFQEYCGALPKEQKEVKKK